MTPKRIEDNRTIASLTPRFSSSGYNYDSSGNTTFDASLRKFTYDAENKQTKVESTNSSQVVTGTIGEYSCDGDGRRVKKSVGIEVTIFVYDTAGKQIAEYSTTVTESTDAKVAYLTTDQLGSPRINTDRDGNVTSRHDYHPFGEEIVTTTRTNHPEYSADTVRQKFTGYERDNEDNLDFAEARYYNSQHGRFTSVDPLLVSASPANPQTWNRYIYCLNNPLIFIDPSGESPGDYYDRDDGSYLGNDGVDDHKVYSGKEKSRTEQDGKIYRQVGEVHDLGISDVEFNTISNIVRHEGVTNDPNEYLWIAHATNNCVQTNCQSMPNRSLSGLLSTSYSSDDDKTPLSPEDNSLRANAARAGIIHVLSGGADPTGGATFWDGTDFILKGRDHRKFKENDSIVIRGDILTNFSNSQGGSSIGFRGQRYANPNPFFGKNQGSWYRGDNLESGFIYRKNNGRGVLYATGTAGKSIFWSKTVWSK